MEFFNSVLSSALLGSLIGSTIVILISESFRRINRVEKYSEIIFERRLEAYEKLAYYFNNAYLSFLKMQNSRNSQTSKDFTENLKKLAQHCEAKRIYINYRLAMECVNFFSNHESSQISINNNKTAYINISNKYMDTIDLLIEMSGVHKVNKTYSKIMSIKKNKNNEDYSELLNLIAIKKYEER